jgi:hypothetical protein
MAPRLASYFALATALGIIATWAATWADVVPAAVAPRQLGASHVAAELATAAALILGAALTLRVGRAHWSLAAALGALVYATLNVLGDFADEPAMLVVLATTLALAVVALIAAFQGTHDGGDGQAT